MSARTRRGLVLFWTALFVSSIILQYVSVFAPTPVDAASGLKAGTVQGFEIDGDLASGNAEDNPGLIPTDLIDGLFTNDDDWLDGTSTSFSGVVDPETPPTSFIIEDLIGSTSDDGFIGGAKETDTRTWGYVAHKPVPKDDIHWAMAYAKFVGNSAYFYVGATRIVNNGTTHMDFELNRKPFKTYSDGVSKPDRSLGDVLVSLEFANGGSDPIVTVYRVTAIVEWPSGQETTFGADLATAAAVHSATNFVDLGDQDLGDQDRAIPAFQFAEASFDLAALGISTGCPGLSTGHIRSRSGGDLESSQLKDSISPFQDNTPAFPIDLNNCGKITIVKDAIPNHAQDFAFTTTGTGLSSFSLDDDADATLPNTKVFSDVVPGAYTIIESAVAGWDLSSLVCNGADGSVSLEGRTATLSVGPNEEITCTFTNTRRGSIVVDKVTVPAGDSQLFTFDPSWGPDFQLADGTTPHDSGVLVPGTYSVSETVPAGWDLTSATCDQGETIEDITLGAGETVTCTFTNTKRGTIIVEKQTSPDGATGSFTFSGDAAGTISDGGQIVVANLVPGTYTSTEGDPGSDFDLGAIVCDDANSTGNVGTRTATFNLEAGETVTCVFTNVQRGSITIIKNAVPDDGQDFAFTTTGSGLSGFTLDDNGNNGDGTSNTKTFLNVVAGSYTVTESAVAGWDLSSLVCNGADGSSGAQDGTNPARANITMVAGGSVTCTFTNSKSDLTIVKSFVGNTGGETPDGFPEAKAGDVLTYTLAYDLTNGPVNNGVITDILPIGLEYVTESATDNAEFTFDSYNAVTRTLTWTADIVSADGSVTYQVLVTEGAAELSQPLINVTTIDSDETDEDSDDELVFVAPPVLAATATPNVTLPPTNTIDPQSDQSNAGFGLTLILLALAGLVLSLGLTTPVPTRVRRTDRRG